jgi:hypothetical protein
VPDNLQREVLSIPDRAYSGFVAYGGPISTPTERLGGHPPADATGTREER